MTARRIPISRCIAMACAVLGVRMAPAAQAQPPATTCQAVPASGRPLSLALADFARKTGFQLVYVSDEIRGISIHATDCGVTPREILLGLLAGTGLTFEFLDPRTVRIYPASGATPNSTAAPLADNPAGDAGNADGPAAGTVNQTMNQGESTMPKKSLLGRLLAALTACGIAGHASQSCAQDAQAQAASPQAGQLQEIVVTAEKRPEDLQKVSMAIDVMKGDQLRQDSKNRLDEIMNGAVGVQVQGSGTGSVFYMRGIESGGSGPPWGTSNTTVAIMMDGVYQDRIETVRGGQVDLSQVEVMRGTQSTTLGASSLAGAISLVSNDPVFKFEGSGSADIGNYDARNIQGVLNIPLTSHQAVRLAYATQSRNSYLSSGIGDEKNNYFRFKYRWQPSENLNTVLTVSRNSIGGDGVDDNKTAATGYWEPYNASSPQVPTGNASCASYHGDNPALIAVMGCPYSWALVANGVTWQQRKDPWNDGLTPAALGMYPYVNTDIDSYSEQVTWNTPIGNLVVVPALEHVHDNTDEPPVGQENFASHVGDYQKTYQVDAHLNSRSSDYIQWIAGVNYYHTAWNQYQRTTSPQLAWFAGNNNPCYEPAGGPDPAAAGNPYWNNTTCYGWQQNDSTQTTKAAYGNVEIPIVSSWRAIAGIRYSQDDKTYTGSVYGPGVFGAVPGNYYGPLPTPGCTGDPYFCSGRSYGAATFHNISYKIGTEYDITPQSMIYAAWSTGYQPGLVQGGGGTVTTVTPNVTLKQITVGTKNRLFHNTLQVNAEFFRSVYDNQTVNGGAPTAGSTDTYCNGVAGSPTGASGPISVYLNDQGACVQYSGTPYIPRSLSQGVDLSVTWTPTSQDRLDFNLETLKSVFDSAPAIPTLTAAQIQQIAGVSSAAAAANAAAAAAVWNSNLASYDGLQLQASPKLSINATYQHRFFLPGGGTLTPRVSAAYKSQYWSESGAGASVPITTVDQAMASHTYSPAIQGGYTLYDAYLAWASGSGNVNVQAYIHNIANKAVMLNSAVTFLQLGAPRTYGISFSTSF